MKIFYWGLKLSVFSALGIIVKYLYNDFGWWAFVIGILAWFAADAKIEKKLNMINEQEVLSAYPFLRTLKSGQLISIKLKNGKEFTNMTYYYYINEEIMISGIPYGEIIESLKDIHSIKLKKISSLEILKQ